MELEEKFSTIEKHYLRVLELTRFQLNLINEGNFDQLGNVLQEKAAQIEAAGAVMTELKSLADERQRAALKVEMRKLGGIIDQVMEIENHCQKRLAMPSTPAVPRSAAANLYKRNVR